MSHIIRVRGQITEIETRDVALTDKQFAELQSGELEAYEILHDAWGENVDFETISVDEVEWEEVAAEAAGGGT